MDAAFQLTIIIWEFGARILLLLKANHMNLTLLVPGYLFIVGDH